MNIGFDNEKYLQMQSAHIRERIAQFDNKLYLEFGGKLFDDFHASRVLPGFRPDSKMRMLMQLSDQAEIVIVISAEDIEKNKIRGDLGITYDSDVLRLMQIYQGLGLYVGSVVITKYNAQESAELFKNRLEKLGIKVYRHYLIPGYPTNVPFIVSDDGYGKNDYIETETPKNYVKQLEWDMAIGLQEVDNLKPSKYLEKLLQENVTGEKTIYEVEKELKEYYTEKENNNDVNHNELECDLVSTRIVELLQEDNFELSINYLKYVHKYLFQDVYEFAGEFRKIDFSKHERILNNDSVAYGDHKLLEQSLDYDITLEKNKNYKEMNIVDVINNITDFSSRIWQIHPFREGNTRTTALFIEKYLVSLGYNVDNTLFKDKSVYFRNALVRSNYFNNYLNIKEDNSFLIKFYENLLLGKNNNLHSKDLIVEELFNKEN